VPVPDDDYDSRPFWGGLAEGCVVLQRCRSCTHQRFPRMPSCPWCGSPESDDLHHDGRGTIYSWVRVHRVLAFGADVLPYSIAAIDLEGGGRIFGRVDPPAAAVIGRAVRAVFHAHEDWTELRFAPDTDNDNDTDTDTDTGVSS
jgi:uncharacterized OB-fold protein